MSQHEVELCALLVDETYGELTSRMFTILLRRGRLTIKSLQEHTQLNRRQLRHGLAVLIQQNLVYYFYDKDTEETLYEANKGAAYGLIRSGKIMEIAERKFGVVGVDVARSLLLLGQATVSDLVGTCTDEENKRKQKEHEQNGESNGVGLDHDMNGYSDNYEYSEKLESVLFDLVEAGLVEPVSRRMFQSPTDTRNEIEKEILKERFGGSTKGTKQKDELKHNIRERLQDLRAEDQELKPMGKKRPFNGNGNGMNGHSKRMKVSNGDSAVNGNHEYEYTGVRLERDLLLRINYEKFTVTLRNDRLVELARERIGETTSRVYAEILRLMEHQIPRCQLDPDIDDMEDLADGPSITTRQLSCEISDEINVAMGIGKTSSNKINDSLFKKEISARRLKVEEGFDDEAHGTASSEDEESEPEDHDMNGNGNGAVADATRVFDELGDDPFEDESNIKSLKRAKVTFEDDIVQPTAQEASENRLLQLKNHLMLLATDSCGFLRRCGSDGGGQWTVDYDYLIAHIRESEVNFMLLENFGQEGHRLVRMMRRLGKVDEKMLPNTALMGQKDIRTKLAEMQMAGMIEVQCIPRDSAHTVNRSIYLWFFDADRVTALVVTKIYKTMARCLQRLEIERRRASGILTLAARSDIQGDIEKALTPNQMNRLREFRSTEDKLVGQLARLDELVCIFRDY